MTEIATDSSFASVWNGRLVQASADVVRRNSEGRLLCIMLAAFAVLWMVYFSVANASVDIHYDLSEESVWAQTFAFGYKHPPMTAWIFRAWFAIFPRTDWAAYLLAVVNITATLAVTWAILRDYLDKERALVGVTALFLVPFYTFLAAHFNANTVMMPFWAAAVLFYLRARRSLQWTDAVFAGVFAGLTFLGKYWGVYLIAGIAVASFAGKDVRRFWLSGAPFLMAIAALAVLVPHIHWLLTSHTTTTQFLETSVMVSASFGAALKTSLFYLGGIASYVVMPLIFFVFLKPNRAALRDTVWPADPWRRQALLLLVVPIVLPALANLAWPHRLTPVWAFPNWALLPVVLFGSPQLNVPAVAAARACMTALVVSLLAAAVSPVVARAHLRSRRTPHNAHYRQVAAEIMRLANTQAVLIGGSEDVVQGLFYYLPAAWPISAPPKGEREKSSIRAHVMVCIEGDAACRAAADSSAGTSGIVSDVTFAKTFLGYSTLPTTYRIVVAFLPNRP